MLIVQCPVGVEGDLGTEHIACRTLELDHVDQISAVGNVAAKSAWRGEGQVCDAVPGGKLDESGSVRAHLMLGGRRQVRWLGKWLAHTVSLPAHPPVTGIS